MNKEYKIETFTDMVNCTNSDNLESFIQDLKGILTSIHFVNQIAKSKGMKDGTFEFENSFTWIDDGKNDITVTLKEERK